MQTEELEKWRANVHQSVKDALEKLDQLQAVEVGGGQLYHVYPAELASILGALLANAAHLIDFLSDDTQRASEAGRPHIPAPRAPQNH